MWQKQLNDDIPDDSPFKNLIMDRAFDDEGDIFHVHLGRGTLKSLGTYKKPGRVSATQFADLIKKHILKE